MNQRCLLFGSVHLPENLSDFKMRLRASIESAILHRGITEFCFGSMGGFDTLAGNVLTDLKAQYPQLALDHFYANLSPDFLPHDSDFASEYANAQQLAYLCKLQDCTMIISYINPSDEDILILLDYAYQKKLIHNLGTYKPQLLDFHR